MPHASISSGLRSQVGSLGRRAAIVLSAKQFEDYGRAVCWRLARDLAEGKDGKVAMRYAEHLLRARVANLARRSPRRRPQRSEQVVTHGRS
jgi:hypothetical protein